MQTSDASNFFRADNDVAREEARKVKAERLKDVGAPISVPGKIIDIKVKGSDVWMAESGHIIRRLSLETGQTRQIYKGHTGPVTCLALADPHYLITGSWDNTIKIWRTSDGSLISSTNAHNDFLKALLVVPSLSLLISSSSDKTVRLWDIRDLERPPAQLGSVAAHTRPVQALAFMKQIDTSGILYTADSLGAIKVWNVQRGHGDSQDCRISLKDEWLPHRTGINTISVGDGLMLTGSSDESFNIEKAPRTTANSNVLHNIAQPSPVRAMLPLFFISPDETYLVVGVGDFLRVYSYDPSSAGDPPEMLCEIEAHSHDITSLGVWMHIGKGKQIELWIISASLDGTLRRWNLKDVLNPQPNDKMTTHEEVKKEEPKNDLTEEEERELAELMEDA